MVCRQLTKAKPTGTFGNQMKRSSTPPPAYNALFGLVQPQICGPYGGRERSVQGAGGETRGEETAGETQA